MKLTRLELSGFKSFADTVNLTFEEGVTAIVGPNGCGKSNVSDAVRWVLGEQSARLLRGGKMEDVIFQGSTARRPVNVTEVSLYLDNSDGDLPIAYREVVVTRRLSRSGQSDYLLNGSPVRLRDIQDLLRGTGLGSDAGVSHRAKMIDLLLSDRADERRSPLRGGGRHRTVSGPEAQHRASARGNRSRSAAGGRPDRGSAVADPESRPPARTRRAARQADRREVRGAGHAGATPARPAQRRSQRGWKPGSPSLPELLPRGARLMEGERRREDTARGRTAAESSRAEIAHRLTAVRIEIGKLDGDLALAAERLANASARRHRAHEERAQMELRAQQASGEREAAETERASAAGGHERIQGELAARAGAEDEVRRRLVEQRQLVRQWEQELQTLAETLRSLEGERAALEGELVALRERAAQAATHRGALAGRAGGGGAAPRSGGGAGRTTRARNRNAPPPRPNGRGTSSRRRANRRRCTAPSGGMRKRRSHR